MYVTPRPIHLSLHLRVYIPIVFLRAGRTGYSSACVRDVVLSLQLLRPCHSAVSSKAFTSKCHSRYLQRRCEIATAPSGFACDTGRDATGLPPLSVIIQACNAAVHIAHLMVST